MPKTGIGDGVRVPRYCARRHKWGTWRWVAAIKGAYLIRWCLEPDCFACDKRKGTK